jgi:hypothetical protein
MALTNYPTHLPAGSINLTPIPPANGSSHVNNMPQIKIQGKMLRCESLITMEEWKNHPTEWIKRKMLSLMLEEMMAENCIEFTMINDVQNRDMVRVRARVYVTPNDQVKILRMNGVK